MKSVWFGSFWPYERSERAGNVVHFQAFRDTADGQNDPNPKDGKMALARSVILLDRAQSPLFARFLARFRHFCRQIKFIYRSVP